MSYRPNFTPRERDIVRLICEGKRNRQIGELLGITEQVIKNHVSAIFDKSGCDSRLQLAVLTVERAWLNEQISA